MTYRSVCTKHSPAAKPAHRYHRLHARQSGSDALFSAASSDCWMGFSISLGPWLPFPTAWGHAEQIRREGVGQLFVPVSVQRWTVSLLTMLVFFFVIPLCLLHTHFVLKLHFRLYRNSRVDCIYGAFLCCCGWCQFVFGKHWLLEGIFSGVHGTNPVITYMHNWDELK